VTSKLHNSCLWIGTLLVSLLAANSWGAENSGIAGWRGDGSGRFAAAKPPTTWAKDSANILWKMEPGKGYSSPVFCGGKPGEAGRLFLTAEPSDLLCIDAGTGEILWRQTVGYAAALGEAEASRIAAEHEKLENERREISKKYDDLRKANPDAPELEALKTERQAVEDRRRDFERQFPPEKRGGAGNAAATVLCDGQRVYAILGTGVVAAFTIDGNRLWAKHIEAPQQGFGHSASPLFAGGRLIVHIDQLTALELDSGKTAWQTQVPAKFGTPIATQIDGKDIIITPSGAIVAAEDGTILAEKLFQMSENAPIAHEGLLFVHEAGQVKAFKLPTSLATPFEMELLWESSSARDQRMASAVYHDGLLYAGGRRGIMDVLDAETGKLVYRKRLDIGELFSSPTLAGDFIYYGGRDGRTLVLKAGREFDEVATNESDRISATPLFVGARLYLRTDRYLYCIGE
jgi:outer membrane protein assembly factor BamB